MPLHAFKLVFMRTLSSSESDALSEALSSIGCDVALGLDSDTQYVAECDYYGAPSLTQAIVNAVHAAERIGITVERVVDVNFLTMSEISARAGVPLDQLERYAIGQLGPGGFPPPTSTATVRSAEQSAERTEYTMLYSWADVASWLQKHASVEVSSFDSTIAAGNLILQLRKHADVPEFDHLLALVTSLTASAAEAAVEHGRQLHTGFGSLNEATAVSVQRAIAMVAKPAVDILRSVHYQVNSQPYRILNIPSSQAPDGRWNGLMVSLFGTIPVIDEVEPCGVPPRTITAEEERTVGKLFGVAGVFLMTECTTMGKQLETTAQGFENKIALNWDLAEVQAVAFKLLTCARTADWRRLWGNTQAGQP